MKAVTFLNRDGTPGLSALVPLSFDVAAFAALPLHREAFELLGIAGVIEHRPRKRGADNGLPSQ